ncbi:unnamed protein product (macronuclear) [Paramecium tetraurelia]|uniref:Tubulin-tyrosine ligase family protein n=1 Tax=Paramecium tetraurelia TaxID=5888 RepID=A0D2V2_PARTE|nr:uncharacterized protein GSPATT00012878001 [Paramecium tetraurelia]CAK77369.1 unnamed protein product [Paramecium tetraurelia]|eukprot:XP_001444766.1 hypothetical protein (macronuclear) [Paramecium tetraurelia strain d4-2]
MAAIQIVQNWIESETDTSGTYFQPCLNCGYELAIKKDPLYCLKSDLYKIFHPQIVLEDSYVFRDYGGNDLARIIIKNQMFDVSPNFTQSGPIQEDDYFNLDIRASVIYPYSKTYLRTHILGKEAGCLFQKYMHIPGQEELALKSLQSLNLRSYLIQLSQVNASIECINEATFQKKSYRMWEQDECQQLFSIINSLEYQNKLQLEGLQFIYKTNKHLGRGVLLVDKENEQLIRKQYNNGTFCGKNNQNVIIQEYIKNPYLFKGHKMEFRSYFQIASTNPPILFGYKKALIKQCALKFNLTDFSKEAHVCNTAITKSLKEDIKQQNNEYYIDWNLEELQDLLLQDGLIISTDWLNEYLMPQIQLKLFHLFNSVQNKLFKDSRVGEFFGVDFILDQNLELWIFECNRNPNFLVVTEGRKEKFNQLIPDMIYLQLEMVRNRFIRISQFLKQKLIPSIRQKSLLEQQELLKHEFLINYQDSFQNQSQLNIDNQAIDITPIQNFSTCFKELEKIKILQKKNY